MKNKWVFYNLTFFTAIIFVGCGPNNSYETTADKLGKISKADSLRRDVIALKETSNEEDTPINEYLTERLKPIRANFKRINSIHKWTSIKKEDLEESTEGGEAIFYYLDGQLQKIITRHYGETFQGLREYYLLIGQLSFVLERLYTYNRPIYWDSATMNEMKDNEVFDFDSSEIMEDRSYFENGILLHQLNNQDCGAPFAEDYLMEEQKRIESEFKTLIKLGNKK